jgi:integrase
MTDSEQPDKPTKRRRGHNEGSVYRTKDGLWRGAVFLGYKTDGTPDRKYISGKTRAEVNRQVTKLLHDHQRGVPIATSTPTVEKFLDQWLEQVVKPRKRPGTYAAYESIVRIHLKPALGRHKIEKLTAQHIRAMLAAKQEAGVAGRTLLNIRGVLRAALNQAMKDDLVSRNVATLTDPPVLEPYEGKPLSPADVTRFLAAASGERLEALFVTAVWLGMRQGELFGLRWQDVDFSAGRLVIAKQLQWSNDKPKVPALVNPKTERSKRRLPLPAPVARVLQLHRRRQLEEKLIAGQRWQGDEWGLIFCSTIGTPLDPSNVTKQYRAVLDKAGIERRRFHDLRHSTGTFLTAKNVHPRVVMQILGHSQISTTMNIYAHVELDTMKDALDALSDFLEADSDAS